MVEEKHGVIVGAISSTMEGIVSLAKRFAPKNDSGHPDVTWDSDPSIVEEGTREQGRRKIPHVRYSWRIRHS